MESTVLFSFTKVGVHTFKMSGNETNADGIVEKEMIFRQ